MDAVFAVPAIDLAITNVRTRSIEILQRDWDRLGAGEKIGFVSTVAVIGLGSLGGALSEPASRQLLLSQLNGRVLPVPGVDWLHVEVNARAGQFDVRGACRCGCAPADESRLRARIAKGHRRRAATATLSLDHWPA